MKATKLAEWQVKQDDVEFGVRLTPELSRGARGLAAPSAPVRVRRHIYLSCFKYTNEATIAPHIGARNVAHSNHRLTVAGRISSTAALTQLRPIEPIP